LIGTTSYELHRPLLTVDLVFSFVKLCYYVLGSLSIDVLWNVSLCSFILSPVISYLLAPHRSVF